MRRRVFSLGHPHYLGAALSIEKRLQFLPNDHDSSAEPQGTRELPLVCEVIGQLPPDAQSSGGGVHGDCGDFPFVRRFDLHFFWPPDIFLIVIAVCP